MSSLMRRFCFGVLVFGATFVGRVADATPFTMQVPTTGVQLPSAYPEAGGVAIVMTGANGNVYYQFSSPDGAFRGFNSSGRPRRFEGNPFTINDPIALDCGYAGCSTYFGGSISRIDIRFSAYDGDTQPGGFDANDINLYMNGYDVGSWTGFQTEKTNRDGTISYGFENGFGNNTFNTGWFSSTDPALLSNILSTGRTTTQVFDADPNDNYWDFRRGGDISDPSLATVAPGYTLEKTLQGGATTYLQVGQVLTYEFIVSNIGSVGINEIEVIDDKVSAAGGTVDCGPQPVFLGAVPSTAPAPASVTCTAQYTVTQADMDAGTLTNTAKATGTPEYGELGELTDSVTLTGPTPQTAATFTKTAAPTSFNAVGDQITYTFELVNSGSVTQQNINITDPKIPSLSCSTGSLPPPLPGQTPGAANTLQCSGVYTVTQADLDAYAINGTTLDNTATAEGVWARGGDYTATATDSVTGPAAVVDMTVAKTALQADFDAVGDVIDYHIEIENTGNVTWPGPPNLDDPKTPDETCPAGAVAPGQTIICTASYTVQQADLDASKFDNTVTATQTLAGQTATVSASESTPAVEKPAMTIAKTLQSGASPMTAAGEVLVYQYVITNTGNVKLSSVAISDDKVSLTCPATELAAGANMTCTSANYTVTQADMNAGSVTNTASGTAETPKGVAYTAPDASLTVNAAQSPALSVAKSTVPAEILPADFYEGATVTYRYTVTNTGNVTITDSVTVNDDKFANPINCFAGPIAPNATQSCDAVYTITAQDVLNSSVTNTATVSAGSVVSDEAKVTIPQAGQPEITLAKTADLTSFNAAAQTITYTFTVTNTGDTVISSLQPITINDPLLGSAFACAGQPTNLHPVGGSQTPTSFSCTRTYSTQNQDITNGQVANSATASFPYDGGASTYTSNTATHVVQADLPPDFTFTKSVAAVDGGTQYDTLGEQVRYTFSVTNNGLQALKTVQITDPLLPGFSCEITDLAPGNTDNTTCFGTIAVTQAHLDAGQIDNTAQAVGSSPYGQTTTKTASAQITINPTAQTRTLGLVKTPAVTTYAAVGDSVNYTLKVTNTGNLTLEGVTVSDPDIGADCVIGTLAPTQIDTSCTGSYVITQADIDAGSYTNTATASATGAANQTASATVTGPTRNALIDVSKQALSSYSVAGDKVTFTIRVENTGNVTLRNVSISDPLFTPALSCTIGDLAPGAVDASCAGTYTVDQQDVDRGEVNNTATVNYDDHTGAGLSTTASAQAQGPTEAPSLSVDKQDTVTPGTFLAGATETFTFTVTNTGNVTIKDVTLNDAQLPYSCAIGSLAPSASVTVGSSCPGATTGAASHTMTQADLDRGSYANTANVSGSTTRGDLGNGSNTPVSASDTLTLTGPAQLPAITLAKSITSGDNFTEVGNVVQYSFVVTNSGNITLTQPISVTDTVSLDGGATQVLPVNCPALPAAGLAPSATLTCTASYTVTQADLDRGFVNNSAVANVRQPVVPSVDGGGNPVYPTGIAELESAPATASATSAQSPEIEITKAIKPGTSLTYENVGDQIVFEFTVTNRGNVTLTDAITVNDSVLGFTNLQCPASGATTVARGESVTCEATWNATQAAIDAGSFTNSATAATTFTTPNGSVPVTDNTPATATANAVQLPKMTVTKSAPSTLVFAVGQTIQYEFVVANEGNTTIDGPVQVYDSLSSSAISCNLDVATGNPRASTDLAPGESAKCTFTYTLTNSDVNSLGVVTNEAYATDAMGAMRSAPDTATIPANVNPALSLDKESSTQTISAAGDVVTYTYEVANTTVPVGGTTVGFSLPIRVYDDKIPGSAIDANGNSYIPCGTSGTLLPTDPPITCQATYTVTQADMDAVRGSGASRETGFVLNNATAKVLFAGQDVVSNIDTVDINAVQDTRIALTKTVDPAVTAAAAGTTLNYVLQAHNTGKQTLSGVTITDDMLDQLTCQVAPTPGGTLTAAPANVVLAPDAVLVCKGSYTVTQADIDAQTLVNNATTTGAAPDGSTVSATASHTQPLQAPNPAVTVNKTVSLSEPQGGYSLIGQVIEYTMVVENTGNITLDNLQVTDSLIPGTCSIATLAPTESDNSCKFSYTVTQADIDRGFIDNRVDVTSQPRNPNASPATAFDTLVRNGPAREPEIVIVKSADVTTFDSTDDDITYTFVLANIGNITITAVPSIVDDHLGPISCPAIPAGGLLPEAELTCIVTHDVTQAEVDAGTITNNVTATVDSPLPGQPVLTASDSLTIGGIRAPAVEITKTPSKTSGAAVGDVITYTYEVTNTGNVTLTNLTLSDDHIAAAGTSNLTIIGGAIPSLLPGAKATRTAQYTVTQGDLDTNTTLTNTVTVTTTAPAGTTAPTDTATANVSVNASAPAFEVYKTIPTAPATLTPGAVVDFQIQVVNKGNVTLSSVTPTEDFKRRDSTALPPLALTGPVSDSGTAGKLDVGETWTYTTSHTLTQEDVDAGGIVNSVSFDATDPFGTTLTDLSYDGTDAGTKPTELVIEPTAGVEVTKTITSTERVLGSEIVFEIRVQNLGNVTLSDVKFTEEALQRLDGTALTATPVFVSADAGSAEGVLKVGETATYEVRHVLDQDDIDAGGLSNSATMSGALPVSPQNPNGATVTDMSDDGDDGDGNTTDDPTQLLVADAPKLDVIKTLEQSGTALGDELLYRITATNTGNVTLNAPTITDTLSRLDGAAVTGPVAAPTLVSGGAAIKPGEAWVYELRYTLDQADIDAGGVSNTAMVTGKTPDGANQESASDVSDDNNDTDGNTTDDPTENPIAGEPALEVIKTVTEIGDSAGKDVVFSIAATNKGNVTLQDLQIADTMTNSAGDALDSSGLTVKSGTPDKVLPGQTVVWELRYTLRQEDLDDGIINNTATVSAGTQSFGALSDVSDNGSGDGSTPTQARLPQIDKLEVTKTATRPTRVDSSSFDVSFTLGVKNTGNVTQTQMELVDDLGRFLAPARLEEIRQIAASGFKTGSLNPGYNGTSDIVLMTSDTALAPGDAGTINMTIRFHVDQPGPDEPNVFSVTSKRITTPQTAEVKIIKVAPRANIEVTKSVTPQSALKGAELTYTLTFKNLQDTNETGLVLVDRMPSGLFYTPGSARVDGTAREPQMIGSELRWSGVDLGANQTITISLQARLSGSTLGRLTNQAVALDQRGEQVSNTAEATVEVKVEPVFDCSELVGHVFDDLNMNGLPDGGAEPGIPNARLVTLDGIVIETDADGRFSVPCAALPQTVGSNFVLKLDPRSLPSGYRVTTENPRVVRMFRGRMTRVYFGAAVSNVVDIDLMAAAFTNDGQPVGALRDGVASLVAQLRQTPSVVKLSYYRKDESAAVARARLDAVEDLLRQAWGSGAYDLRVEREIYRVN